MARIGIIADELPPAPGGVQSYVKGLVPALMALGHDLTVFTMAGHLGIGHGLCCEVLPVLQGRRRWDLPILREFTRSHGIRTWHCMGAGYAWLATDFPDAKVTVSAHGNDFLCPYPMCQRLDFPVRSGLNRFHRLDDFVGRWLSRRALSHGFQKSIAILTNSQYTANRLAGAYPFVNPNKIHAVGVGLNKTFEIEANRPSSYIKSDLFKLLTVARLDCRRKNIEGVLHALAILNDSSILYTVAGSGKHLDDLKNLAAELGLEKQVKFTGYVSENNLLNLYSSSDLFIMVPKMESISYEGFGIVYIEANAFGLPVIAGGNGGAAEAFLPGRTGLAADPENFTDIAEKICEIRQNRKIFRSEICKEFARNFNWAKISQVLNQIWINHDFKLNKNLNATQVNAIS